MAVHVSLHDAAAHLELTCCLDEGDLIAGATALLKVVEADGTIRLQHFSEGMNFLEIVGALQHALKVELDLETHDV